MKKPQFRVPFLFSLLCLMLVSCSQTEISLQEQLEVSINKEGNKVYIDITNISSTEATLEFKQGKTEHIVIFKKVPNSEGDRELVYRTSYDKATDEITKILLPGEKLKSEFDVSNLNLEPGVYILDYKLPAERTEIYTNLAFVVKE